MAKKKHYCERCGEELIDTYKFKGHKYCRRCYDIEDENEYSNQSGNYLKKDTFGFWEKTFLSR